MKCPLCDGEGGYSDDFTIPYHDCEYCKGTGKVWFWKRFWWWWIDTKVHYFICKTWHKIIGDEE